MTRVNRAAVVPTLAEYHLQNETAPVLQPTELLHEVYLRLSEYEHPHFRDRSHFFGAASSLIRRILYLDRLVHAAHTPVKAFDPARGQSRALTSVPCANYCVLFTATPDGSRLLWGAIERDQSDTRMVDLP